jgi:hypothetical protein
MRPGIRVKRAPQAQSSGSKARAARPRSSDKQQDALLYFAFPGSPVPVTIVIMACQFDAQLRPQKPIVWGLDQCRSLLSASVQCACPTVCSRWLRSAVCKSPSAQRPIMTANANMSAMKVSSACVSTPRSRRCCFRGSRLAQALARRAHPVTNSWGAWESCRAHLLNLSQGRQHVLPECVDKAQLPPPDLVQVDFGETHSRVLAQPGSVLSQVRGDQD